MIKRLLVANRGEIAVRIMRACRELGVESVAVYSDADARAPHVWAADRTVAIGAAPASDSYLSIDRIVEAARASAADAVHPGYGFLAENARFAAACEKAGLVFVGPPSRVIAQMGSKIDARAVMARAGVPIVPGETPADQSDEGIEQAIARTGLPALIKASAGGGGKGMRLVREAADAREAAQAARREALAAFGDGTLYVERLIERPRHVEVQVFGDRQGHVLHLFERECSVQRRHQKVLEESPSPALTPALRRRMTEAAVTAARAVSYVNAGTVEFLVDRQPRDADAPFYFLEMNTRLQVEHPVTELVAGVDMVQAQLLVAGGEPLPWRQESLTQRGHAIEARVYAEDPSAEYLPQAGRLLLYREPRMPGVRVDAGVAEGDEVTVHYDPLLAKVIGAAETREQARARLAAALRAFPILGLRTNIPFLLRVLEDPRFRAGAVDTGFLDAEGAALAARPPDEVPRPVADAWARHIDAHRAGTSIAAAWDPWAPAAAGGVRIGDGIYRVEIDGRAEIVYVAGPADDRWAFWKGQVYRGAVDEGGAAPRRRAPRSDGGQTLTAPMPATVMRVLVQPGASVRKGDTVVVLEAMKMELPIRAAGDAVVATVHCREGELVKADAVLVTLS